MEARDRRGDHGEDQWNEEGGGGVREEGGGGVREGGEEAAVGLRANVKLQKKIQKKTKN